LAVALAAVLPVALEGALHGVLPTC
jgi:hypothetical protein